MSMSPYLNETYKKIIDDSLDGFFVMDRRYCVIQCNKSFREMFNSKYPEREVACLTDLVEGEARRALETRIDDVFRLGNSDTVDIELVNRSGMLRYYLVSLNPLEEPGGGRGVFGFLKDITEIKRLQHMIENERNYNRSIIETVNLGFALVDDQNEYLDYNRAYLGILGREEYDLVGRTFHDFTVDRYRDLQERIMEELQRSGTSVSFEKEFLRKDGSKVPVVVTMSRLLDKNAKPIGNFAFIKDISDRKRIERELIEKSERTVRLINLYTVVSAKLLNSGAIRDVYVIVSDAAMEIVYPSAVEIFAWGRRGFRSVYTRNTEPRRETNFIKDAQCPVISKMQEDLSPLFVSDAKAELTSKDFRFFPGLKKNASAIFVPVNMKGAVGGFMVLSFSSVLAELDDAVLKLLTGIANLASITIEKLLSQREQTAMQNALDRSERLTAMGRIIAGVAHEINNPLSIIQFDLDDLKNMIAARGEAPEEFHGILGSIQEEIDRMSGIVGQLKDFSKPEEKSDEKVLVDEVIKTYPLKIVIKNIKKKGVSVKTCLAGGDRHVSISKNHLIQVLMNLINNAEDAVGGLDRGEIVIETRIEDRNGAHLAVAVRDNGAGIEADDLSRVFEPFFTTKKSEGTGLGLSISYSIVKGYNGEIGVRSSRGSGSEFTVYLPLEN